MRNDFESNYLMHHGIQGQKWGVRRFQNPDGSLTSAGKERYRKVSPKTEGDQVVSAGSKYERVYVNLNKNVEQAIGLTDEVKAYKSKRKYVSPDANQYLNDYFMGTEDNTRVKTYQMVKNSVIAGEKAINDILLEIGEKPLLESYYDGDPDPSEGTSRDFLMDNIEIGTKFIEKAISKGYAGTIDLADIEIGFADNPTILFNGYEKVKDESYNEYMDNRYKRRRKNHA